MHKQVVKVFHLINFNSQPVNSTGWIPCSTHNPVNKYFDVEMQILHIAHKLLKYKNAPIEVPPKLQFCKRF